MKRKILSKSISLLISFAMVLTIFTTAIPVKAEKGGEKTAMQLYVEAMQPGWNLGNTFDATGDETSWGNPATTKELIDQIAAAGFKSIRIPITWKHRMGDAPDYKINEAFMKRIQEVVDWSLADGLYVMINLHHDSGWIMNMESQHDEVLGRFNAAWTQISGYFKDYPHKLMFESINEPRYSDDWGKDTPEYFKMLNELNTSFHKIVRKSGGNNAIRPLVLPTLTCSPSQARLDELNKTITKLNDKNIIATVHYYGYWPFSVNIAGGTRFDEAARSDVVQAFDRAYNTFTSKGIPVIVGEYGLLGFDQSLGTIQHGEMLKYFEYMTYYGKEKGFTLMLWDNGQHFDRRAFKWEDEDLYNVIIAGLKSRSSNAKTDSIYIKKDGTIADAKIQMNLNGNELVDIKNGDKTLVEGTDYDLSGNTLTFKAGLLETLVTREFGVNATLTCKFSAGADWKINVIYYDTPRLKSVKGMNIAFFIPTEFNGDRLATMEATYKAGGNAGPNDWTPFKGYNSDFAPLYDSKEISVTGDFFRAVKDGDVVLKMHFWSGEVVEYTVTKSGAKITGVSSQEPQEVQESKEPVSSSVTTAEENTQKEAEATAANSVEVTSNAPEQTDSSGNHNVILLISGIVIVILLLIIGGIYLNKKGRKSQV